MGFVLQMPHLKSWARKKPLPEPPTALSQLQFENVVFRKTFCQGAGVAVIMAVGNKDRGASPCNSGTLKVCWRAIGERYRQITQSPSVFNHQFNDKALLLRYAQCKIKLNKEGNKMNLKEAFRFQNKLQSLMEEAQSILGNEANITRVQNTYLRKKAMKDFEDETTEEAPSTEYSQQITSVAEFLLYLLKEREQLTAAICRAKAGLNLPAGLDGEVSLNARRQDIARLLRWMAGLRNSEVVLPNGGNGYCFNNEGNQVSYRCDVKRVTTIHFDRNKIRKMCSELSRKADAVSSSLDAALVTTQVDYTAPFDVNDTFAESFGIFIGDVE